jgi:branched-chain amino acid transport system ATP-binding protein
MLEVSGLTVSYGHIEAVREVSFRVEQGAIVSLVGPNGAGKTTILNAISGVVPPARGSIRFQGRDITHMRPHRRVSEGIVQIPEGRLVLANMTVRENLELGAFRPDPRGPVGTCQHDRSGKPGTGGFPPACR